MTPSLAASSRGCWIGVSTFPLAVRGRLPSAPWAKPKSSDCSRPSMDPGGDGRRERSFC